jgi:hypothetical protein
MKCEIPPIIHSMKCEIPPIIQSVIMPALMEMSPMPIDMHN